MYKVTDLFDMRQVVGARLEQILSERNMTKSKFCEVTGISRPTLDKILTASITNKRNYEKHLNKILDVLEMTPDVFMGTAVNKYMQFRKLKDILSYSVEHIAEASGLSVEKIKDIELGKEVELSELRNCAFAMHTSVNCLLEKNYFQPQLATLQDFLDFYHSDDTLADVGFWGHVGILPLHSDTYLWYPITRIVRNRIYELLDESRMIIPCMNNKVLWLNMNQISKIILLDEACDQPSFTNWDSSVDCGETPLVVYETLKDYVEYKEYGQTPPENLISPLMCSYLDEYIADHGELEEFEYRENLITLYSPNGSIEQNEIDFAQSESILTEITNVYEMDGFTNSDKFLWYEDLNGIEVILNTDAISVIELPLIEVENEIYEMQMEMMNELRDDHHIFD